MSSGMRIVLGVALLAIGLGFLALAGWIGSLGDDFPPAASYVMGGLGVFCGLGALACFSRRSHPLTIRLLGGTIFAVSLWYVGSQAFVGGGGADPGPGDQVRQEAEDEDPFANNRMKRRARPSLVNSLLFFGLVGLPSGFAAVTGRYPFWGMGGKAFNR